MKGELVSFVLVWLYILATFKALTHSDYNAAPLRDQGAWTGIMTQDPTWSYYPDRALTSHITAEWQAR